MLKYGLTMRLRCPHEPKPLCKKCSDPCYKPEYREKIREVMRFSGTYLVRRGRIDLIFPISGRDGDNLPWEESSRATPFGLSYCRTEGVVNF